jgi:hypothetical protein
MMRLIAQTTFALRPTITSINQAQKPKKLHTIVIKHDYEVDSVVACVNYPPGFQVYP